MTDAIDWIRLLMGDHPGWAAVIVALVTFGESLFLLGFLVPSTALMLLFGGLIGSGAVPALPILIGASIGAAAGDTGSYILGRWAGPSLFQWRIVHRHRRSIIAARLFFVRFGFASVLIGRFLGPMRATVPLVVGIVKMRQLPFQVANVISGVLWSIFMLIPGWLAGRGLWMLDPQTPFQWVLLMGGFTALLCGLSVVGGWIAARLIPAAPGNHRAATKAALRDMRRRAA